MTPLTRLPLLTLAVPLPCIGTRFGDAPQLHRVAFPGPGRS